MIIAIVSILLELEQGIGPVFRVTVLRHVCPCCYNFALLASEVEDQCTVVASDLHEVC